MVLRDTILFAGDGNCPKSFYQVGEPAVNRLKPLKHARASSLDSPQIPHGAGGSDRAAWPPAPLLVCSCSTTITPAEAKRMMQFLARCQSLDEVT